MNIEDSKGDKDIFGKMPDTPKQKKAEAKEPTKKDIDTRQLEYEERQKLWLTLDNDFLFRHRI